LHSCCSFSTQAAAQFHGAHFYLKGGNALSLRKGVPLTGDYDFQLMPALAEYANWPQTLQQWNARILNALEVTLRAAQTAGITSALFDESVFSRANLIAWSADDNNPLSGVDYKSISDPRAKNKLYYHRHIIWQAHIF
jgi:hypothetical protein